jgi:hypothetical protein
MNPTGSSSSRLWTLEAPPPDAPLCGAAGRRAAEGKTGSWTPLEPLDSLADVGKELAHNASMLEMVT